MTETSHFIDFCLLASFIYQAPNMKPNSREFWSWFWLLAATIFAIIRFFTKG